MSLICDAVKSFAQPSRGFAAIFSFGRNSLIQPAARKAAVSSACAIQSERFTCDSSAALPRLFLDILLERIGGKLEVLSPHHPHERRHQHVEPLGIHLELVLDLRLFALRREHEAMAA